MSAAAVAALLAAASLPSASAGEEAPSIVKLASDFVKARALESGAGVRAVSMTAPAGFEIPADLSDVRFRISRPVATGRLALTAVVQEGGRPVRSLVLSGEVIVEAEVSVAARDLAKGKVIEEADVRSEIRALPEGLDPREVRVKAAGRETRSAVAAGAIFTESNLAQPREVLRGETVSLLAEGRGFSLRVLATAGRDGVHGERIPVVNTSSGQTVIAEVTGKGVVRLASRPAQIGRLSE